MYKCKLRNGYKVVHLLFCNHLVILLQISCILTVSLAWRSTSMQSSKASRLRLSGICNEEAGGVHSVSMRGLTLDTAGLFFTMGLTLLGRSLG